MDEKLKKAIAALCAALRKIDNARSFTAGLTPDADDEKYWTAVKLEQDGELALEKAAREVRLAAGEVES